MHTLLRCRYRPSDGPDFSVGDAKAKAKIAAKSADGMIEGYVLGFIGSHFNAICVPLAGGRAETRDLSMIEFEPPTPPRPPATPIPPVQPEQTRVAFEFGGAPLGVTSFGTTLQAQLGALNFAKSNDNSLQASASLLPPSNAVQLGKPMSIAQMFATNPGLTEVQHSAATILGAQAHVASYGKTNMVGQLIEAERARRAKSAAEAILQGNAQAMCTAIGPTPALAPEPAVELTPDEPAPGPSRRIYNVELQWQTLLHKLSTVIPVMAATVSGAIQQAEGLVREGGEAMCWWTRFPEERFASNPPIQDGFTDLRAISVRYVGDYGKLLTFVVNNEPAASTEEPADEPAEEPAAEPAEEAPPELPHPYEYKDSSPYHVRVEIDVPGGPKNSPLVANVTMWAPSPLVAVQRVAQTPVQMLQRHWFTSESRELYDIASMLKRADLEVSRVLRVAVARWQGNTSDGSDVYHVKTYPQAFAGGPAYTLQFSPELSRRPKLDQSN